MDSLDEKGSGSADRGSGGEERRCCADCRTTKTPLWRGGPSGPKSLCNACGIRYRKRRRETARSKEKERERERGEGEGEGIGASLNLRVLEVDGEGEVVVKRRSTMAEAATKKRMGITGEEEEVVVKRRSTMAEAATRKKRMGEEEEERAAALLVALSSGLLYA